MYKYYNYKLLQIVNSVELCIDLISDTFLQLVFRNIANKLTHNFFSKIKNKKVVLKIPHKNIIQNLI